MCEVDLTILKSSAILPDDDTISKLQIGKCLQQYARYGSKRIRFVRQCLLQRLSIHVGAVEENLRDQNITSE